MTELAKFQKLNVSNGELAVYTALNAPNVQAYNAGFSKLLLPHAISFDKATSTLTMPHYQGETFNDVWDVENGGSPMDISLTGDIALVIKDLSTINTSLLTDDETLSQVPKLAYDQEQAVRYFGGLCLDFTREGVLSDYEHDTAIELIRYKQTTEPIISNGDFYPRNLIRQPDGKLVLIDWETWNPHSPFYLVDHPENVAAVQYAHMWGNPEWQAAFRVELDKQFAWSAESFDKGVVIKALTLACFFRKHQALFNGQISLLKRVLIKY